MSGIRIDEGEAAARLPRLLDMVTAGENVVIMRCGKPVARLVTASTVTEADGERRARGRAAVEALKEYRRTAPSLGDVSIKEMIEEGRM